MFPFDERHHVLLRFFSYIHDPKPLKMCVSSNITSCGEDVADFFVSSLGYFIEHLDDLCVPGNVSLWCTQIYLNYDITSIRIIWVRSRNCGCLVTWFCYQLIAKPGNKTAAVPWSHLYDDGIKWKHFPRYWPLVREIHWSPVNFPHKGQWRGAWMFSLICT